MTNKLTFPILKGILSPKPIDIDKGIESLLYEWKEIKLTLETLYRNRDQQNTKEGMERGVSLFIQFLFWSNDQEVILSNSISLDSLEIVPVNVEERLNFILLRPNLFHSYRQLSELMVEQEKLFAKSKIIKKASKPKG